ncbi:MAG TPA: HEAT repeat domain-containing protein, partial [Gemmataceae bacterium]|nr:HEAT repeat domain-containing protein [Gemmataceae bacterium]
DTCFALLFLRRANLVQDLTKSLKGKVVDPGERVLRASRQRGRTKMATGIESKDAKPLDKPVLKATSVEGNQIASALLKATVSRRNELLETMESEKGVQYTEALAVVIPKLEGETQRKARRALANRLTRMKDETLQEYFRDDDVEIRRAAALAAGQKDSKSLVPDLIGLLRDPQIIVVRAAHASLKELTEQDFGPAAEATREERDQAVRKWIDWWSKQRKKK